MQAVAGRGRPGYVRLTAVPRWSNQWDISKLVEKINTPRRQFPYSLCPMLDHLLDLRAPDLALAVWLVLHASRQSLWTPVRGSLSYSLMSSLIHRNFAISCVPEFSGILEQGDRPAFELVAEAQVKVKEYALCPRESMWVHLDWTA